MGDNGKKSILRSLLCSCFCCTCRSTTADDKQQYHFKSRKALTRALEQLNNNKAKAPSWIFVGDDVFEGDVDHSSMALLVEFFQKISVEFPRCSFGVQFGKSPKAWFRQLGICWKVPVVLVANLLHVMADNQLKMHTFNLGYI
jgi:hypothetical protein